MQPSARERRRAALAAIERQAEQLAPELRAALLAAIEDPSQARARRLEERDRDIRELFERHYPELTSMRARARAIERDLATATRIRRSLASAGGRAALIFRIVGAFGDSLPGWRQIMNIANGDRG